MGYAASRPMMLLHDALLQPHPGAASVFGNEFDPGGLEGTAQNVERRVLGRGFPAFKIADRRVTDLQPAEFPARCFSPTWGKSHFRSNLRETRFPHHAENLVPRNFPKKEKTARPIWRAMISTP